MDTCSKLSFSSFFWSPPQPPGTSGAGASPPHPVGNAMGGSSGLGFSLASSTGYYVGI
jgi:hypothetical protein